MIDSANILSPLNNSANLDEKVILAELIVSLNSRDSAIVLFQAENSFKVIET